MFTKQPVVRMFLGDGGEASVHESAVPASEEGEKGAVTPVSWSSGLMLAPNTCLLAHDGRTRPTISHLVSQ